MNYSCTSLDNNSCVDEEESQWVDCRMRFVVYFGIRTAQVTVGIIGNVLTLIIIFKLKQRLNGHIIMVLPGGV